MKQILAYIAGVIDSDGTIGIKKSTYAIRVTKDSTQPTYSERVCVKQVEPQAVDLIYSLFGGYRGVQKAGLQKGKPLHVVQLTDQKAYLLLVAIKPYLRIKKRQALNCLALRKIKEASKVARVAIGRGHTGAAIRPTKFSKAMERKCERAHQLNRVGI